MEDSEFERLIYGMLRDFQQLGLLPKPNLNSGFPAPSVFNLSSTTAHCFLLLVPNDVTGCKRCAAESSHTVIPLDPGLFVL